MSLIPCFDGDEPPRLAPAFLGKIKANLTVVEPWWHLNPKPIHHSAQQMTIREAAQSSLPRRNAVEALIDNDPINHHELSRSAERFRKPIGMVQLQSHRND